MSRSDISFHLDPIDALVVDINNFIPNSMNGTASIRANLAGLLVVTISASYENCIKETLINYAARHHNNFGKFVTNNYSRINSRIDISDLHNYARAFDILINNQFKDLLSERTKKIEMRTGKNICTSYKQILQWRHAFAHAWQKNTTIEEAISTHKLAKRVLYIFNQSFE